MSEEVRIEESAAEATCDVADDVQKKKDELSREVFHGDTMLDEDEGEECEDVKSNAVIKFETVKTPAKFIELQRNTDLKEAPSNWLQGGSKWEHLLREASLGKDHSFSSINMAHSFPDLTGSIDVISDANNIKKLLKIPYSKSHLSMMVHRVGDSLLLDDFDIHKHLLRKQESDWEWVRKFFYETVMESVRAENAKIVKKNKSRDHLQNRNMFSKFLYYSLAADEESGALGPEGPSSSPMDRSLEALDLIPDPLSKGQREDVDHVRTVLWNFEDIHMLIGTDLPIFGGGTHPCVSLRLRDMKKPISILTGLDYWLDNLMCNVPEIAMCYHLDGIVQGYELFKTEDIPHLKNSQFSPTVIKNIAQNILSFLKSNATKEGHTYWLFKGHDDDIVKLYDLSTLCEAPEGQENPFTVPVAILLYRVARSMRQTAGRKKSCTILRLLENSLLLLSDDLAYSQVVTSAHYLLSDLYLSDNIYKPDEGFDGGDESDAEEDPSPDAQGDEEEKKTEEQAACSVAVQSLFTQHRPQSPQGTVTHRHQAITGALSERCAGALAHISKGLLCLDQNAADTVLRNKHKVDPQKQPNPNEAIPLHYQPISKQRGSGDKAGANQVSVMGQKEADWPAKSTSLPEGTWHKLSKTLMLKKAAIAYHGLAECNIAQAKYGQALRCVNLGLMCLDTMGVLLQQKLDENRHISSGLLALAGDAHLQMQDDCSHNDDFRDLQDDDLIIASSINLELDKFELTGLCEPQNGALASTESGVSCYREALRRVNMSEGDVVASVKKRLGNALNVQGLHYMRKATHMLNSKDALGSQERESHMKRLCELSCSSLKESLQQFQDVGDGTNTALLHSNMANLLRLVAQLPPDQPRTEPRTAEYSDYERHCYTQATECYLKAVELLEESELLSSVRWELSRTYFTMATLMQDYAPLSRKAQEQVEKEVSKLMMLSLKYCDVDKQSAHQRACRYQAATIHHRLASLYHNAYRNQMSDERRRELRQLADTHYDKAAELFPVSHNPCELVRLTLERFAMHEFQLQGQTSQLKKLKTLQQCIRLLLRCLPCVHQIACLLSSPGDSSCQPSGHQGYQQEAEKLVPILYSRLQHVLLSLVRISAPLSKKSKPLEKAQHENMRQLYDIFLKAVPLGWENNDILTRSRQLSNILQVLDENSHLLDSSGMTAKSPSRKSSD